MLLMKDEIFNVIVESEKEYVIHEHVELNHFHPKMSSGISGNSAFYKYIGDIKLYE